MKSREESKSECQDWECLWCLSDIFKIVVLLLPTLPVGHYSVSLIANSVYQHRNSIHEPSGVCSKRESEGTTSAEETSIYPVSQTFAEFAVKKLSFCYDWSLYLSKGKLATTFSPVQMCESKIVSSVREQVPRVYWK
jgi:hypothetical protein